MYRALSESTGLKYYLSVASDASCESGCRERGGCHTQPSAGATVQGFQHGLTDGLGKTTTAGIGYSIHTQTDITRKSYCWLGGGYGTYPTTTTIVQIFQHSLV